MKSLKQTISKLFSKKDLAIADNQVSKTQAEGNSYKRILKMDSLIPQAVHSFFDKKLEEVIKDKVGARYQEANRILSEETGLDLASYGYCQ